MSLTQHWKLDDNAASTTVVATVGTNAALVGGDNTSAKSTTGPGGSITAALDLNGTDDAIDISGSGISIAAGNAWSISFWAKFDVTTAAGLLGTAGSNAGRILKTDDTTILVFGPSTTFAVPALGTTNWHHVLITHTTGNSIRVFVDGTESSTGAKTDASSLVINRIGLQNANWLDGKVAQVKIFDSDESANVAALFAEGSGGGGTANRRRRFFMGSGS